MNVVIVTLLSLFCYLSGFFVLFTPLPLFYAFVKRGNKDGLAAALLAITVLFFLSSFALAKVMPGSSLESSFSSGGVQFFSLAYYGFFAILAYFLADGLRKPYNLQQWIGNSVFVSFGAMVGLFLLVEALGIVPIVSGMKAYLQLVVSELIALNKAAGVDARQLSVLAKHQTEISTFALQILPAVFFIFTLLCAVFNALLGSKVIKAGFKLPGRPELFRLSDQVVWLMIGAGIAFFLDAYLLHTSWIRVLALNLLFALSALYFLQGLAVIAYFLRKLRAHFFRTFIYVFIFLFFQTLGPLIVGLGIVDVWFNFRARMARKDKTIH